MKKCVGALRDGRDWEGRADIACAAEHQITQFAGFHALTITQTLHYQKGGPAIVKKRKVEV